MGTIRQKVELLKIGGKYEKVTALIDSGASASFISKKLAKKIGYKIFRNGEVILGDGSAMKVKLVGSLIKIKGWEMPIKLAITDIDGDGMIIGVDFMQEHDYILVFKDDRLHVKKFDKKKEKLRL